MWITIIIGAAGNSNMHYQMDLRIHKSLSLSLYAIYRTTLIIVMCCYSIVYAYIRMASEVTSAAASASSTPPIVCQVLL